jgi:hypothetical protein
MTESELNVSKELIGDKITTDLGKRKICVKFVPHTLYVMRKTQMTGCLQRFYSNS